MHKFVKGSTRDYLGHRKIVFDAHRVCIPVIGNGYGTVISNKILYDYVEMVTRQAREYLEQHGYFSEEREVNQLKDALKREQRKNTNLQSKIRKAEDALKGQKTIQWPTMGSHPEDY